MIGTILPGILALIGQVVDRVTEDKDQAAKLKADITLAVLEQGRAQLQGAVDIIKAEAGGESWLQRNWRPILMLVIVAIVGNNYLIAPYLAAMGLQAPVLDLPERLWDLMTLGVGGYIGGRTIEKGIAAWKG